MSNVSFEKTLEKRRKEKEQERHYEDLLIDSEKYEPVGKGANNKPSSEMSEYEKVANEHGILSKEAIDAMTSEYLLSGSEKDAWDIVSERRQQREAAQTDTANKSQISESGKILLSLRQKKDETEGATSAEYVGATTSTGENESGGDGMEGFEGYMLRVLGREDLAKKAEEKAGREREENELVGEIKQSDYIDESSISFSRWELMGFIIALIVGIIVSALIVVAVKNNKRDRNRTVKNAIACDMESEAEAFMAH